MLNNKRGDYFMRVKELIEALEKCDPEAEIRILTCDDNPINEEYIDFINGIIIIETEPKSNLSAVYIDSRTK